MGKNVTEYLSESKPRQSERVALYCRVREELKEDAAAIVAEMNVRLKKSWSMEDVVTAGLEKFVAENRARFLR